jgi:hypothetical protein
VDSPGPSDAEDPVRRRTFTRLAGASLVGAVLADTAVGTGPLHEAQSLVTALVTPESGPAAAQPAEFSALTKAVANAKRAYQACRYTEVMSQLPTLLPALQAACDNLDGDARLRARAPCPPTPTTSRPASCSSWTTTGSRG